MNRSIIITSIFLLQIFRLEAQQSALLFHPYLNQYLFNPASAGMNDYTQCNLQYQKMMSNFSGAPETFVFTAEHPLNNPAMGIGLTFINDKANVISNTAGYFSYRYRLMFAERHKLSGALSLGLVHNSIQFGKVEAQFPDESSLYDMASSQTAPDANISLLYSLDNFSVGISSFNLLNTQFKYYDQHNLNNATYSLVRQYNAVLQYKYSFSPSFKIIPHLLIETVQGMPFVFSPSLMASFRDKVWLGATYRPKTGASMCFGLAIQEKYTLTYAYGRSFASTNNITGPSHELTFGIRFSTSKGSSSAPVVKQEFTREEFDRLVAVSQKQLEAIDKLNKKNSEMKDLVDGNETTLKEQQIEIQRMHQILQKERETVSKIAEQQKRQDNLSAKATNKAIEQAAAQAKPEVEIPKDTADNVFEETRYHVIVGAYLSLVDAEMFRDILKKERGIVTRIIPSEETDNFLIYSRGVKDDDDAEKGTVHKLSYQKYKLGNIWFYNQKTGNKKLDLGFSAKSEEAKP